MFLLVTEGDVLFLLVPTALGGRGFLGASPSEDEEVLDAAFHSHLERFRGLIR